jgi:hypothetical protein
MPQGIISVEYTVTHHGRPVGVTDLGFARFDDRHRAGWFFPHGLSPAAGAVFDCEGQFNFELRHPDGSIVPTEWIGIQDTERLLKLAAEQQEEELEADQWFDCDCADEPDWMQTEEPDWTASDSPDWLPDVDDSDLPRYQILVRLATFHRLVCEADDQRPLMN